MPLADLAARRIYNAAYRENHRLTLCEKAKANWHSKAKFETEKNTAIRRKRRYGLTTEQYEAMLVFQDGKCALCGTGKPVDIDHDHASGRVRGLLCRSCNVGLGQLGDTVEGLERAIAYLKRVG
jgi:Recombination endonuclease VII